MASNMRRRDVLKIAALAGISGAVPLSSAFADAEIASAASSKSRPQQQQSGGSEAGATKPWGARWIWYPGQRAAHLHTAVSQAALERVTHLGFPGFSQRAEYQAWFRYRTTLPEDTELRWANPLGRMRVRVNGREGDVTVRHRAIKKGSIEIVTVLDMTRSLPCFLLEGGAIATGSDWETSLDGIHWLPAESQEQPSVANIFPDRDRDVLQLLTPQRVAKLSNGSAHDGVYQLGRNGELLLDFREIEIGTIAFSASGTGAVRVNVGESEFEALDWDPDHAEQHPLPPISLEPRPQSFALPDRAARFVAFRSESPCTIRSVTLNARRYNAPLRGSFECSDTRLNEIWKAGVATLRACIHHSTILDAAKRDGLEWLMDQNIDFDATDCLYFDPDIVRNTVLAQTLPRHPQPTDVGIFDNVIYYILGYDHDYAVRGDSDFICRYRPQITDVLDLFESLQDSSGFVAARRFAPSKDSGAAASVEGVDYLGEFYPDWAGVADHGDPRPSDLDCSGTPAYAQMMIMRCFEVGSGFARLWGDNAQADRYSAIAGRMRTNIVSTFWDRDRAAFINGLDRHGHRDERLSSYAQTWGILLDLISPENADRLFSEVFENPQRRAKNIGVQVYWEYQAYVKCGRFSRVLDLLRKYWGQMLDEGFTRFIEDIRPDDDARQRLAFYGRPYGLSLNHGWTGSAAVSLLMQGTIGLDVKDAGFRTCTLQPNWRAFDWVRVELPTPHGMLSIKYSRADGAEIHVPANMVLRVGDAEPHAGPCTMRVS